MSASDIFEIAASVLFLFLGLWATFYAHRFADARMLGPLRWNSAFKRQLRWIGPFLALSSAAALLSEYSTVTARREQAQVSAERKAVEAIVNDRSTWVDPVH